MTKAKHTPSSQTRLTPATGSSGTNENPLFWSIEKVDDCGRYLGELAHVHGGSDVSREERDANAKLFLAAPDLLEALERMTYLQSGGPVKTSDVNMWLKEARAAIAKAKGEA